MKLQEFFNTQKDTSFTDVDKLDLYQSILYKKTKQASLKRSSFVHAKYFVYTMVFAILMTGMYGVYFMNDGNFQDNNRFAIKSNTTNTVQADYIAQVIDVKGSFSIEHKGVLATTNNIGNGDTILLKEGTQLVFEINSGTKSKIIGPAKLIIQKTTDENYKLNLIYGNFIQMEGKQTTAQTIELAINDITVKQQDKSQPLNFKFVKEGKNQIFQNNGADIIVTKSNGEDKVTTISNKQVVAIQSNDIKVFANIDTFTKAVQEKNVSQTFSLTKEETTTSGTAKVETIETALLSLLNTPQIGENKEEITKEISSVLSDEKQILDPIQDEKVNSSLYVDFYTPELKALESAFLAGDDEEFNSNFVKIEGRIQTVYQSFGMLYSKILGTPNEKIKALESAIISLKEKITNNYKVPPKYIENLQSIEKTLSNILSQSYGSTAVQETKTDMQTDTPAEKTIQE
ncbi:MAG: hypothetical protein WC010_03000 [Candidatus Absconditabacterales bacterium]